MVESEKVGRKIPNLELALEHIDILITDTDLGEESKTKYRIPWCSVIWLIQRKNKFKYYAFTFL